MMTSFSRQLSLLWCFLLFAAVTADEPKPGDPIDWTIDFPQWWHDIKNEYELREVRKCEFLEFVPDTGDHCPGVSRKDHYYCIYGDETHATWYCTCIEKVGDFVFHCASEMHTPQAIAAIAAAAQETDPPRPPTSPPTNRPTKSPTDVEIIGPQPGDAINWTLPFPQWWHTIKDQYELREVRKCEFLEFIPDSGDRCPGVSRKDHYYCIYGDETHATWFCTCIEKVGEFIFHCADELHDMATIFAMEAAESGNSTINVVPTAQPTTALVPVTDPPQTAVTDPPVPATNPPASSPPTIADMTTGDATSVARAVPKPGDPIDWTLDFPQWWYDIKDQYELREVRKCEFLEFVPDTCNHCPSVSKRNHYYCIYGDNTHATWFCTCVEKVGDFHFHCDTELRTPKYIESNADINSCSANNTASSSAEEEPMFTKETETTFAGGFMSGIGFMSICIIIFSTAKRYYNRTTMMKQKVALDEFEYDDPDHGIEWVRKASIL